MNKISQILTVFAITTNVVLAEDAFTMGGFGVGLHKHFTPNSKSGHVISLLNKNGTQYKYIWKSENEGLLSKKDGDLEITIDRNVGINHIALTYLVDVVESDEFISILLVKAQAYHYIKMVKKYPLNNPPTGESYMTFPDKFKDQKWKPYKYVSFTPKGIDPADFFDIIKNINYAGLASSESIKIEHEKNRSELYLITENSVELGGKVFKDLDFKHKLVLESEFIKRLDAMDDKQLFELSKDVMLDKTKELNAPFKFALDSMRDRAAAGRIKARILSLHEQ